MKTRIIKTKFWSDNNIQGFSSSSRLLFIYLLTCQFVGLTSYIEISDGQIKLDTGLTMDQLIKSKNELQSNKRVFFYNGWVFIPNLDKHNPYWKSPKTEVAYKEETKNIPTFILDQFNKLIDSTMDSTMDSTPIVPLIHKTENIIHKSYKERGVRREDLTDEILQEIADKYHVPLSFVQSKLDDVDNYVAAHGKPYKDYKAALSNFVKKDALKIIERERQHVNKFKVTKL